MNFLRQFADNGIAVIVVSAVGRGKDSKGRSTYDTLNLASFRESSELEFGCDDAFILASGSDDTVTLRHLKARHGEARDLPLTFSGAFQRFTPADAGAPFGPPKGRLQSALDALWGRSTSADDGETEADE